MSQFMSTSPSTYQVRLMTGMHKMLLLRFASQRASISELLKRVEDAMTPTQLHKAVNKVQNRLWGLPAAEQITMRESLINALILHVHNAQQSSLRIEAARWLRLLVQAGLTQHPQTIFATFVTAATRLNGTTKKEVEEQLAYLTLLFECFVSFHHPYPAYSWQLFPSNELFFPLIGLLEQSDGFLQEGLLAVFAELPTLDDPQITERLLPVALAWANHADPERRRRVTHVLARFSQSSTRTALYQLQADSDPIVRASARSAANSMRKA